MFKLGQRLAWNPTVRTSLCVAIGLGFFSLTLARADEILTEPQSATSLPDFLPANILQMDSKFAHHILIVEKQSHKLHVFENESGIPKLLKTYSIATGKFKGNKSSDGDHKTPEGIYDLNGFLSQEDLQKKFGGQAKIYGAGAFPTNYPNLIDERAGKKGGGIWLHSTDDDSRISKELDSRGCVVAQNADLHEISQYIEVEHTPIIITQDASFLSRGTWAQNRKDILSVVSKWMKAWQEKDFTGYIDAYDPQFHDKTRGGYSAYRAYKQSVFARADKPSILFDFISVLSSPEYAVVYFQQDYRSSAINDLGKKTLFLKKVNTYDWKIVGELWDKIEPTNVGFNPSQRFFKSQ